MSRTKTVYLVSISGGKDSQAALLYMLKHYQKEKIIAYTADTGWEHEDTYKHIEYLSREVLPIEVIRSDKYTGFEDMCISRKAFPTRLRRFCTEELKMVPSDKYIKEWQSKGYKVINVVGVRADESRNRSGEGLWKTSFMGKPAKMVKRKGVYKMPSKKAMAKYYSQNNTVIIYQPVVYWTAVDVLKFNIECGTRNNPLYDQGYSRVGCMPCIMARKEEIGFLSDFHISRIEKLEANVAVVSGKEVGEKPTFFQDKSKTGKKQGVVEYVRKRKYNTLNFDLGCINPYGFCE